MKILAIFCLALACTTVQAEWVPFAGNAERTDYHDPTMTRRAGDRVRIWVLTDYKSPQSLPDAKRYLSSVNQFEIDCANGAYRTPFTSIYSGAMRAGTHLGSANDFQLDWQPAMPQTRPGHLVKIACDR